TFRKPSLVESRLFLSGLDVLPDEDEAAFIRLEVREVPGLPHPPGRQYDIAGQVHPLVLEGQRHPVVLCGGRLAMAAARETGRNSDKQAEDDFAQHGLPLRRPLPLLMAYRILNTNTTTTHFERQSGTDM